MKQEDRLQIKKDLKEFIRCAIKDGATDRDYDLIIDEICKLNNQQWVEEIKRYVCSECSTPGFVHFVVPVKIWQGIGGE